MSNRDAQRPYALAPRQQLLVIRTSMARCLPPASTCKYGTTVRASRLGILRWAEGKARADPPVPQPLAPLICLKLDPLTYDMFVLPQSARAPYGTRARTKDMEHIPELTLFPTLQYHSAHQRKTGALCRMHSAGTAR